MMTPIAALALVLFTIPCSAVVVLASMLGIPSGKGSIYERTARFWGKGLVRGSGVRTRVHGDIDGANPHVYVANHVSWYDVFTIAAVLPRWAFVAKAELRKIPIFGAAAEAVGTVFIDRANRRNAFSMYEQAAQRIRDGASVVVCPEGTRSDSYALRPFKKGPFVLAISSGVPIVPVIVHGTREVMKRGSWMVSAGTVDLHFLEPIPTAGLTYADRDALVAKVWTAMATAMRESYGIESDARNASRNIDTDSSPSGRARALPAT
jgi:1-acyl-sn-glycerol-3-phosphate acyltransferase